MKEDFFILLDDIDFRKDFSNLEELKRFRIDGRKFEDIISELDEEDLILIIIKMLVY